MIPDEWTTGPAAVSPPEIERVHDLFAAQVQRTPRATAVQAHDRCLSYAELDALANALAHRLRAHGVGPNSVVAVFLGQSSDRLVSLLAVWKAGGAALLLDPSYPRERIAFVLRDSGARTFLTHSSLAARLPSVAPNALCLVDADLEAQPPSEPPEATARAADLAFVTYTSGSTGHPKGVAIEHRSLVAHADAMARIFVDEAAGTGSGERVLQACPFGFDMFLLEVGTALFHGGTLCLPASGVTLAGPQLASALRELRISFAVLGPSILLHQQVEPFPELTTIVCAGEPLPEQVVDAWAPGRRLFNGYGPSETTVLSTVATCEPGAGAPNIGRPVAHERVYILDPRLRPVRPGEQGEIYIGGAGVARGYLHRPGLTAERFLPDPHSTESGARMYRSGDLARWAADGAIVYLGRLDNQIKLNGLRIEPEEIEAVLGAHPSVKACVITADDNPSGNKQLVAHVVGRENAAVSSGELRQYLRDRLPYYMVPSLYLNRDALPLSPNGKVDRPALAASAEKAHNLAEGPVSVEAVLREIWAAVLGVRNVGLDEAFFDAGGDSLQLISLRARINERLGTEISIADLFEHPTIRKLARHVETSQPLPRPPEPRAPIPIAADAIAIIGMAGRFPGAADVDELWELLRTGREAIERGGSDDRPDHVRAAGLIRTDFDPSFFGYVPADVRRIDPQQHLFLEAAWAALESAGYAPGERLGSVGVFGGSGLPHHWLRQMAEQDERLSADRQSAVIGNPLFFLTTHVAHKLGLRGPAVTVNTACSTSLVAVHLACRSLAKQECSLALAGGVSLLPAGADGYAREDSGLFSRDGYCRPFDAHADGAVPASGVCVIVLKPLAAALADGDHIHAVIRGSAINNDGSRKAGFTAPSVEGQREVIIEAYGAAGIDMATVGYVQAHGTGTRLGDPIEVQALTQAFRRETDRTGFCLLGSIKGNLGHLDAAAGVCGLVAAALALEHGKVPGTLHFKQPNPELRLEHSPFRVNPTTLTWPSSPAHPRRAGVSSFGLGGTNAHVVLEQAPSALVTSSSAGDRPVQLLLTSARDGAALADTNAHLAAHLREQTAIELADVAFTLHQGRTGMRHRSAAVCANYSDAAAALDQDGDPAVFYGVCEDTVPEVAFLFPGAASQHADMGRGLYESEPAYQEGFDRCAAFFDAELGCELRSLVFPDSAVRAQTEAELQRPTRNFAAIAATQLAMASLLQAWGIKPTVVFGHSLGEYAAACVAGVLDVKSMVKLVAARGRLCENLPPAAMLALPLAEADAVRILGGGLALAAVNSPRHCVVSGPVQAIEELEAALARQAVKTWRLPLAGGTHSALVEPVMEELDQAAAAVEHHAPRMRMLSGLTGTWLGSGEIDSSYWARHLRGTVRFADGLGALLRESNAAVVELGPGQSLSRLAAVHPAAGEDRVICPTMAPPDADPGTGDLRAVLSALGRLWCRGVEIDGDAFWSGRKRHRVPLPTYPFRRPGGPGIPARPTGPAAKAETPVTARSAAASLETVLTEVWKELLGVASVAPHDDFFEAGGDSLLAVRLRTRLQQRLGTAVATHALLEHSTFADLLEHLQQLRPDVRPQRTSAGPLLMTLQQGRADRPPLVLVQAIGGTAYAYQDLARRLDPDQPVLVFRAYGLEAGEEPPDTVAAIAARNVAELLRHRPQGPYVLGGHSSGGLIAQEMACQLSVRGHEVRLVVMIDSTSIADSRRLGLRTVADILAAFETFRHTAPKTWEAFRTALESDAAVRRIVVATNEAVLRHEPAPCRADLLFIRAADRESLLTAHPEADWAQLFHGAITVRTVPGNHMTLIEPPLTASTAEVIREHLAGLPGCAPESVARQAGEAGGGGLSACAPSGLRVEGLTRADAAWLLRHVGGIRLPAQQTTP